MGRLHEWKGRKQHETQGYPFDNGPPFKTPVTGNPNTDVFPPGVTPPAALFLTAAVDGSNPQLWNFTVVGGVDPIVVDFGDGTATATGRTQAHTYAAGGGYTVTVSDAEQAIDTEAITVTGN